MTNEKQRCGGTGRLEDFSTDEHLCSPCPGCPDCKPEVQAAGGGENDIYGHENHEHPGPTGCEKCPGDPLNPCDHCGTPPDPPGEIGEALEGLEAALSYASNLISSADPEFQKAFPHLSTVREWVGSVKQYHPQSAVLAMRILRKDAEITRLRETNENSLLAFDELTKLRLWVVKNCSTAKEGESVIDFAIREITRLRELAVGWVVERDTYRKALEEARGIAEDAPVEGNLIFYNRCQHFLSKTDHLHLSPEKKPEGEAAPGSLNHCGPEIGEPKFPGETKRCSCGHAWITVFREMKHPMDYSTTEGRLVWKWVDPEACKTCGGEGETTADCPACEGKCYEYCHGPVCVVCRGSGREPCPTCKGETEGGERQ